jgi:hypothetical protein
LNTMNTSGSLQVLAQMQEKGGQKSEKAVWWDNNIFLVEYLEEKKPMYFPTKSFRSKAGSRFV